MIVLYRAGAVWIEMLVFFIGYREFTLTLQVTHSEFNLVSARFTTDSSVYICYVSCFEFKWSGKSIRLAHQYSAVDTGPRFNQVTPLHHLAFVFVSHALQYSRCYNKIVNTLV